MNIRRFIDGYHTICAPEEGDMSNITPEELGEESPLAKVVEEKEEIVGPQTDPGQPKPAVEKTEEEPAVEEPAVEEPAVEEPVVEEEEEIEEYELTLSANSPLSAEDLNKIVEVAEKYNLSQEEAQALIKEKEEIHSRAVGSVREQRQAELMKQREEMMADPDFGGDKFPEALKVMALPIKQFGDKDLAALMHSDLGYSPAFARFLYKLGNAMKSDTFVGNGDKGDPVQEDFLRRMYGDFYKNS